MKLHENDFYIGIDIGTYSTVISYIDQQSGEPIVLDPSGGFGQRCIPSYMGQDELGEWLVGEEAIDLEDAMNMTSEVIEDLNLFKTYILALVESVLHVNPKALIKGLVITCSMQRGQIDQLALTGLLKKLPLLSQLAVCKVVKNEEAMIAYMDKAQLTEMQNSMVIDFGHKAFRCYTIAKNKQYRIELLSHSEQLSGHRLLEDLQAYFLQAYRLHSPETLITEEINHFVKKLVLTYYPYIFRNYKEKKPLKVTYNFAFPPFQLRVDYASLVELIEPYKERLSIVVNSFALEVDETLLALVGNGIRMDWPIQLFDALGYKIGDREIEAYSKGAALIAMDSKWQANILYVGVLNEDYGLMDDQGQFVVLGQRGQRFKDQFDEVYVTMTSDEAKVISLYKRSGVDQIEAIKDIKCVTESLEEIYNISIQLRFDDDKRPDLAIRYLPI